MRWEQHPRLQRAARWLGDVARGYTRVADARDAALAQLDRNHPEAAGAIVWACEEIAANRATVGPLGIGARLAMTEDELRALRIAAEDVAGPLHVSTTPIGEA
jgi:hypothetical protein